ncbi:MAG: carboxypeptidase regulatory-like domain-containing protein [Planctomycetes bacterium]|nr:carboxypeptidase regulatory-like domain-containing protein [Planctomycetota bacterium]
MARRNHFLVVTMFVMVAVLIGAILLVRGGDDGTPIAPDAATTGGDAPTDPAALRRAGAGTDDPARAANTAETNASRETVPAPEIAAGRRVRLTGRLVRDDGTSAASVGIEFVPRDNDELPLPLRLRRAERDDARTTTGSDGRFTIAVEPDLRGALMLARDDKLVFADGERRTTAVEAIAKDHDLGDLRVVDGLALSGQVLDDVGRPLPSARLRVGEGVALFGFGGEESVVDGEGRFSITGLEPGPVHVSVSAAGFVPEMRSVELSRAKANDEQSFQLKRGASIAGIVYDDLGRPLGGAKVAALRRSSVGTGIEVQQFDVRDSVETASNGTFVVAGMEGEAATLRVSRAGHATESVPGVAVGRSDVVVQLQRNGSIRGVLRDPNGTPLAGSEIRARPSGRDQALTRPGEDLAMPSIGTAKTDANGAFVVDNVRPGTVTLSAEGQDHLPLGAITVQVPPGGVVEHVQLVAEIGASIDALVVDANGAPVAGAEVGVARRDENTEDVQVGPGTRRARRIVARAGASEDGPRRRIFRGDDTDLRTATSGADGHAKLTGLPGGPLVVRATHESLAPAKPTETLVPMRGVVEVVLTMRPAGHVQIAVRDRAGKAVGGARFVLHGPEGDDSAEHRGSSGSDGNARVGPLLAGRYEAVLEVPPEPVDFGGMSVVIGDSGTEMAASRVLADVRAGETAELTLLQPTLTRLSGVVTDASGPVAGAEVRLQRVTEDSLPGFGGKTRRSDAQGVFSFEDLTPGKWRVEWKRAERPVAAEEEFEIAPETPAMTKDLRIAGGTVRVHVRSNADQQALARAEVALEKVSQGPVTERRVVTAVMVRADAGGDGDTGAQSLSMQSGPGRVRTDDEGLAVIEEVPPGEWRVTVEHPKHCNGQSEKLVVADAKETDAGWIAMDPAGSVRGKVTGIPADDPVGGALIVVKRVDKPDGDERRETAMGGTFRIERLAPGEYELRASSIGPGEPKEGPPQRVTVRAGEVTRVDLPFGV